MKRGLRVFAWILLLAVALVTLVPPELRPSTNLPLKVERGLAFALLSFIFVLAYSRYWVAIAVVAVLAAFGLEAGQVLVPGRDASLTDAIVKTLGGLAGVVVGFLINASLERWQKAKSDLQ